MYGLGADASSVDAVHRLFAVKGRPVDHPVIVHLGDAAQLDEWAARVPEAARVLAASCWPGPLTVIVPRAARVPDAVTGGLATVGLRVPDQPLALELLRAFGGGVAAPSANRFGRVSPTTAADVRADLGADVDLVLDGGPCRVGVESTIVDCSGAHPAIARLGGVSREQVEDLLGAPVPILNAGEVRAPGTLASHYAPRARVEVVDGSALAARVTAALDDGERVGVIGAEPDAAGRRGPRRTGGCRDVRTRPVPHAARRRCAVARPRARGRPCRSRRPGGRGRGPAAPGRHAMNEGPIGVFDSGLGGLTVLRALIDLLPDERVVYFGDTGRFPYGPKPQGEVLAHALEITDVLLGHEVKALVVACNSAAAAALDVLRDRLDIPVVGVIEPGLRAAARVTRSGRIGVIGTVGTIASGAYQRLATDDIDVTCAACPGFVEFVEAGDVDSDQVHVLAERLLAPVREATVDTLVLGCTHYPLLARTIGDVMGRNVVLVSSADETAFAVRDLLTSQGMLTSGSPSDPRHVFFTSGPVDTFRTLGVRFLGPEVASVEPWHWG